MGGKGDLIYAIDPVEEWRFEECLAGADELAAAFATGLQPDPDYNVWQWAEANLILDSKSSKEAGPYRVGRTPYAREIMECLSRSSPVREVTWMKGSQIGATVAGVAWTGYVMDASPRPMLSVQPDRDLAERHSTQRIRPMIEQCRSLQLKIQEQKRAGKSADQALMMDYPGGQLLLVGAKSASAFRSMTFGDGHADEIDAWDQDVGGEGSPMALMVRGTATYGDTKKLFWTSTPTDAESSAIAKKFEEGDQSYFHVPCPHCGGMQRLQWTRDDGSYGITWEGHTEDEIRTSVGYACVHCGTLIRESYKTEMLDRGEWVPTHPERKYHRSFHLSSLYSPLGWLSWADCVLKFLAAKGSVPAMKAFVNLVLGETFVSEGERPSWKKLYDRRESYKIGTLPPGALYVTCGADVQGDRIECVIVGHGPNRESWVMDYEVMTGDPDGEEPWAKLEAVLGRTYDYGNGSQIPIAALAVDASDKTNRVYQWVRSMAQPGRIYAVKGQQKLDSIFAPPSAKNVTLSNGRRAFGGVKLYSIGSNLLKVELYGRLRAAQPPKDEGQPYPPGFIHFPRLSEEFFRQLTAEVWAESTDKRGFVKREFKKIRARNEALDVMCYARAAAAISGMDGWTEANWNALRRQRETGAAPTIRAEKQAAASAEELPPIVEQRVEEPDPQEDKGPSAPVKKKTGFPLGAKVAHVPKQHARRKRRGGWLAGCRPPRNS